VSRGGKARGIVERWRMPGTGPLPSLAAELDERTAESDLIVDASDDPATKFAVSDWAVTNGRQYVIAAALRYGGNVMAGVPGVACYRCLFEEPETDGPTCADAGVLGPVVGAIGGVAAAVALSLVKGDRSLVGALLAFDDLRVVAEPRVVRFAPRPGCPACLRAPISPLATPVRIAQPERRP
jgi:adenylyltransferase/sulfurtransferase